MDNFSNVNWKEIPENLKIGKINGPKNIRETVTMDFKLWILSRCKAPLLTNGTSLIATKSLISIINVE